MGSNIAARRAAKAQRRKVVVAQKRRVEAMSNSLPAQARQAAALPIQQCFVGGDLLGAGMGTLYLVRGATPYRVWVASFLLDSMALGAKDVSLREFDGQEFKKHVDLLSGFMTITPMEPSKARKLMHDLVAWSAAAGYGPHKDYAAVERAFGDVRAEDCTETFQFGRDGRPVLIPGPFDRHVDKESMLDEGLIELAGTVE